MATVVISEDEKLKSPEDSKSDGDNEQAVAYGQMIESHRQAQQKIVQLESQLATMEASGEASRAEIRALQSRIDQLIETLEAEEEEQEEEMDVTVITPPAPEPPKEEEKPKETKKSALEKFLFG
jgi:hypothetical protein